MDTFTFEYNGREYTAEITPDDCGETPWDNQSWGVVSDWSRGGRNGFGYFTKEPGQMILASDRHACLKFDFVATIAQYREDGCSRKVAAEAAYADFKRFKAWCADEWYYTTLKVSYVDPIDEEEYVEYLGGIESDAGEYFKECALEMAAQIDDQLPSPIVTKMIKQMEAFA